MTNKEAIEILKNYHNGYFGYKIDDVHKAHNLAIKALEERPHGEWETSFEMNGKTYHKCTHCHISTQLIFIDNFCPNCGADMRGGGKC